MAALKNAKHERFYVYAVRIGGQTRYVGKGTGQRAQTHLRASHNPTLRAEVNAAKATGVSVRVRIVVQGLSEREAYRIERRMIAKWAGNLTNVAMGSYTEAEHLAMQCRANLLTLKTEEQVRREGAWLGVSAEDRIGHLRQIRQQLERLAEAA